MSKTVGTSHARKRTAILISGRGSNMQALVDAAREPEYPAEIVAVISNRPDAAGIGWAQAAGLTTEIVDHKPFGRDRPAFESALGETLARHGVELIALAGFMRLLTAEFVDAWSGRMINIHPSLLPAFKGLDTHQRALEAGVRITGCTVHFVVPEMDAGPIIAQAAVPITDTDTADTLAHRVLTCEHALYPAALADVASGHCRLTDGRVIRATLAENRETALPSSTALFVPPLAP